MALLGDDGRGYELARKLESHGVWRTWLGDSLYSSFIHFLASASAWEAFMRADSPSDSSTSTSSAAAVAAVDSFKTRAQLHLQLRARALLFDKASISLFLRSTNNPQLSSSSSSSIAISKLNPNYLQLHGDDVYFTLEEAAQRSDSVLAAANSTSSKSKSAFGVGARYTESEIGSLPQRFKFDELPETWYSQFFEKYRASKSYRLSFGDQETEKRTPEQMYTYVRVAEKHKRKRVAFKVDQNIGVGNSMPDNGSNTLLTSILEDNNTLDDEAPFFPETMFTMNCVPDSAVLRKRRVPVNQKVEFNGVLDNLPQIVTKSPIMIERLGIRPEYLSMDPGGNQNRGIGGYDGRKKLLSQDQASQLSQKVIARFLLKVGFEASSEVPLEVLSRLLSCHVHKLGCTLKLLADSYRKQCSAMELLKMFLHTTGYGNLGVLSELVKDNTSRTSASQTQQQLQGAQLQFQSQHQGPIRQSQQVPRQMHPQLQQLINSQNLAFQQQHWERMKRRQQLAPRPGMNMNVNMDKDRAMVEVKVENPSDFSLDNSTFPTISARHPQVQLRQQQLAAAMTSFHAQTSNQFRPVSSVQMQSPNMGMVRAPPVKVEGFQELMGGGDATLKPDSEENKLTSPAK